MPCRTDDYFPENTRAIAEANMLRAALCGILRVLQDPVAVAYLAACIEGAAGDGDKVIMNQIDYAEAGITKKWLQRWWEDHQAEDAKRLEREEAAKRKEKIRQDALAKLTPAERKALNL